MEKTTSLLQESKTVKENLQLKDRKILIFDGIVEIISTNETSILAKLKDTNITISGTGIHITKLDIEKGILEAEGLFESIKYGKNANIFKRFFK